MKRKLTVECPVPVDLSTIELVHLRLKKMSLGTERLFKSGARNKYPKDFESYCRQWLIDVFCCSVYKIQEKKKTFRIFLKYFFKRFN